MAGDRKILLTGGTGFIGKAVSSHLLSSGHAVLAVTRDDRSPSARTLAENGAELLVVAEPEAFADTLAGLPISHVLHAAAPGIKPEDRTWSRLNQGCTVYTLSLLEALQDHNIDRFLNVGSWSEYAPPVNEAEAIAETFPLESRNLYGAAKAGAFLSAQAFAEQKNIPFVSTRLFNVYGPGEADSRLIPYVITKLIAGETVDLTPGLQERDFVFVEDVAEALIRLLLTPGQIKNSVYNICSGAGTSVRDMVYTAARALKADESLLKFGARPYRPDEPLRVTGNPSRLKYELDWVAQTPVETGVIALVNDLLKRGKGRI